MSVRVILFNTDLFCLIQLNTLLTLIKAFQGNLWVHQAVHKGSGKNYQYHRQVFFQIIPLFVRKNCVIIPSVAFQPLQEFFKTGHNPTHNWETKGNGNALIFE